MNYSPVLEHAFFQTVSKGNTVLQLYESVQENNPQPLTLTKLQQATYTGRDYQCCGDQIETEKPLPVRVNDPVDWYTGVGIHISSL